MKGDDARDALMCECGHPRRDHDTADAGECLHGLIVCECSAFTAVEHCVTMLVDGEGVRMTFNRAPTDEDVELVSAIVRAGRKAAATLAPEQVERQRAARERIHERNARIRGEQ